MSNRLKVHLCGAISVGGHGPGSEFKIPCDNKGVPTDAYWRRRFKDEKHSPNGQIEFSEVEETEVATSPTETEIKGDGRRGKKG